MLFKRGKDYWGVFEAVKEIFGSSYVSHTEDSVEIFFHQIVPDIYKASRESVIRHRKDIEQLALTFNPKEIWIKRNGQIKSAPLTDNLRRELKNFELPEYQEIENERSRWQHQPGYRYPERTQALEEEMVQLRFIKKGGKNE